MEVEHLFWSVGCARSKRQCLTVLKNQRSCRWMLVGVWTVYGILVIEVLGTLHRIPKHAHGKLVLRHKSHPRLVLDQNVDLSNTGQAPSTHISLVVHFRSFDEDDHQEGRSPTMTHVSCTHRVVLDWLFEKINLDPKVQIKHVDSKNECQTFKQKAVSSVISDATCCISLWFQERHHIFLWPFLQPFFSFRRKAISKDLHLFRQCCLVSRQCVSVGQHYSSNLESSRSTRDSSVALETQKWKIWMVRCSSVPRETVSTREKSHISMWTRFFRGKPYIFLKNKQ